MCKTKQRSYVGKEVEWSKEVVTPSTRFTLYVLCKLYNILMIDTMLFFCQFSVCIYLDKPEIIYDKFIYMKDPTNFDLNCTISYSPDLNISWHQVGLLSSLLMGHQDELLKEYGFNKFIISRVKVNRTGPYICTANNAAGTTMTTIYLVPQSKLFPIRLN